MGSLGKTLMENVRALMSYSVEAGFNRNMQGGKQRGNHRGSSWEHVDQGDTSGSDTKTSSLGNGTHPGDSSQEASGRQQSRSPECFDHISCV